MLPTVRMFNLKSLGIVITFCLLQFFRTVSTCDNNTTSGSGCNLQQEQNTLICKDIVDVSEAVNVTSLKICDYGNSVLNLSKLLRAFPFLKHLTVYGGNVNQVHLTENIKNHLEVLDLQHLKLQDFDIPLYVLNELKVLNLQSNHLVNFDVNLEPNIQEAYISGNRFNCSLNLMWALRLNRTVVKDAQNLTCYGELYEGKPLILIAKLLKNLKRQCPKICNCSMTNIVYDIKTEGLEPIILMNCTGKDLDQLPKKLPLYTRILILNENNIEDLSPLLTNPVYRSVQDLYLDNNRVKSIEGLEGSYWFTHFRVFSLSGNELSQLPTYALDNALQINPNMPDAVRLYLGRNPWRCDCIYTPNFQELLQEYKEQIGDVDDVICSYLEGDENSLLPILSLSRSSVCRPSSEYSVRALDLLNAVLASLIILILGKLAYDYYYFKRTGKLPWIVMKMP